MSESLSTGRTTENGIRTVVRLCSLLIVAAGVATLTGCIIIAVHAYSPVWFGDEWEFARDYVRFGFHYPLRQFWVQHGAHRIPIIKALQLLDLLWFQGNRLPLILMNWIVQSALWFTLMYFLWRTREFSKTELATLAGITAWFVFNPNQMQNFEWAFQVAFLSAFLLVTVAIAAIGLCAVDPGAAVDPWRCWKLLAIAVLATFLAECNLASGILTWIVMPLSALLFRLRGRIVALLSGVAIPGMATFFIGYQPQSTVPRPLEAFRHMGQVGAYMEGLFSESWHYIGLWIGIAFAAVAVLVIVYVLVRRFRLRKRLTTTQAFTLSLAALMFCTAVMTALGRYFLGAAQAHEGRYQTPAMLFWWALLVFLFASAPPATPQRRRVTVIIQAFFLIVFLLEAARFHALLERYSADAYIRNTAGLAVQAGIYDEPTIHAISLWPSAVQPTYDLLRSRGLMAVPFPEIGDVGKNVKTVFSVLPSGSCVGGADYLRIVAVRPGERDLFVEGWGYYTGGHEPFRRVVATASDGVIIGVGIGGGSRFGNLSSGPGVGSADTGWRLYAKAGASTDRLAVYGIVPGKQSVCLLVPGKEIPGS